MKVEMKMTKGSVNAIYKNSPSHSLIIYVFILFLRLFKLNYKTVYRYSQIKKKCCQWHLYSQK